MHIGDEMEINKEREAFEAEFSKIKSDIAFWLHTWDEEMQGYNHPVMCWFWYMWQAANAKAVPEWISVNDKMPDEGDEVLVHSLGQVRQVTRDSKWAGGFKERNCYGWQAAYGQSHWMPKNIELPEQYHFYYENDAKQKAMIDEVSQ